jgi:hypothetical protein
MNTKFFSIAFFSFNFFICVNLFGQDERPIAKEEPAKVTFYYNQSWELTTPDKSAFKREALFDLQEMVFDGVYKDYNKENIVVTEGFYAKGAKRGIQTEYYDDQTIKSTIEFADWDFIIWQMVNSKKEYVVTRGTGKFTIDYFYYNDLKFKRGILTGEFQNGKRAGKWVYTDLKSVKTDVEYYKNGKLATRYFFTKNDSIEANDQKEIFLSVYSLYTEALAFDKDVYTTVNQFFESQVTYPSSFQRNISYPGGLKRLLWLLSQETEVRDRNLALVKLKINERGQILKSSIIRSVDDNTDDRVLEAIKQHESRFLPAIKDGLPIATSVYLPVASGEEWMKTLREMPAEWFLDSRNFQD